MTKGVKFRSIFYRYVLFIIVLFFLGFNQIVGRGIQTVNIFGYAFSFHQTQLGYFLLLLILVGIGINFLCPWKFSVSPKGIYLRRLALFLSFLGVILVEFRMFGLTRRVILVVGLIFITINV